MTLSADKTEKKSRIVQLCKPVSLVLVVRKLIGVLLLTLLIACNIPLRKPPPFTTKEPKKADLAGTWVPNVSTLKMMRGKGGYDPSVKTSLVLRDDGTFELSHLPDWWRSNDSRSHGQFEDYSGHWSIATMDSKVWRLFLNSEKLNRDVDLFGEKPAYQIAFRIGDPDFDEWMIFEKH